MHNYRWLRPGVRFAAVLAALLSLAGTASAATDIQGVQINERNTTFDSVNQKGNFTNCPSGKVVLSTGGLRLPSGSQAIAGFQR